MSDEREFGSDQAAPGAVSLQLPIESLQQLGLVSHPKELPDLSDLEPVQWSQLALNVLCGHPHADMSGPWSRLWLVNITRVMDKSVIEYQAARTASLDFARTFPSNRISPYYRAVNHFENCINSLVRSYEHGKQLSITGGPPDDLRYLRNAIEHTATRIDDGWYEEGQYAYLDLAETDLRIQDSTMSYERLASLIRSLRRTFERTAVESSTVDSLGPGRC
jgi:hypothetical protein